MAQYIDKAVVVAEIKRRKKELIELSNDFTNQWACGSLDNILSFLDTIEAKEVDLEKEANEAWNYIFSHGWDENSRMVLKHDEYMAFAQRFFELGLNAQESRN